MIKLSIAGFFGQFKPLASMMLIREEHQLVFAQRMQDHLFTGAYAHLLRPS